MPSSSSTTFEGAGFVKRPEMPDTSEAEVSSFHPHKPSPFRPQTGKQHLNKLSTSIIFQDILLRRTLRPQPHPKSPQPRTWYLEPPYPP